MSGKGTFWLLVLVPTFLGVWFSAADAAPPWASVLTFSRVEADPNKQYRLAEENGPWMILACSFSGEGALEQAEELVYELRKQHKFQAYVHPKRFEFGDTHGRGLDRFGAPLRMRHRRDNIHEVAVMVGNYPRVDDPKAQKTLKTLKHARPRCLEIQEDKPTHQSLAGWRMTQQKVQEVFGSAKKTKGPMGHAFITTSPLLPQDYFTAGGIDPLVVKMNKPVKHSLLDCPGKYTVQVATFKGKVIIEQREIRKAQSGEELGSELADAGNKAHLLTEALRMKGWEAYEFHDRYASIVTVGSFQSAGTPRADGKIEINPAVQSVMTTFAATPASVPAPSGTLPTAVKSLLGIPFDPQPIVVHVPKRSISREMAAGPF